VIAAAVLVLSLPPLRGNAALAALFAGALVALGLGLLEGWRLRRLLNWLRAPRASAAPLVEGPWGDLAYRVERLLEGQRRKLEAERQQRQEFLSAIEASPNGVLLLDAQEQIAWLNTPAAEHFDLHPQRDLRQRITNLMRQPAFVQYLQDGVFAQPLALALRDGRHLAITVRPYGDGALLLLSQDVSDRELAEAMRRDFVANASHEIRTPLAALSGFVESLRTLDLAPPERAQVLELMQQQARRMEALVDDLLILAKLEGGARPPNDSWYSLGPLLDSVRAEALALSAGRHEFAWPEPSSLEFAGVESELHSALTNLLSNAIRYTPAGGRIELICAPEPDGSLLLVVRDSGPGIAAEHLPRLTERFYRVEASRSRESGGTGLGLAIVKHIAQRHGAQLRIASEPGVGSQFGLLWPALRIRVGGGEHGLGEEAAPALWARR
jgi:two-component system phosphate regulon sensor histidine kinase PhoR